MMNTDLPRRKSLGMLVLSMLGSSALLQGCNNIPSTIKIGVAFPLSGPLAASGQDMLNGVIMAVEEINKDGFQINGKKVTLEVVARDDKADIETGKEVAKQLVAEGVTAVIGHFNSGISIATAPTYAEKGIPQLSISTNPKYTSLGLDTTFRLVANDELQSKAISSFCVSKFQTNTRYGVFDDGTKYGKDLAEAVSAQLKAANKEITLRQTFDNKTTEFAELAGKIKAEKVEIIITMLNDFQILPLFAELKKINYTNVNVLGGDSIKTTQMLEGAEMVKGLYATSPVIEANEFTTGNAFLTKYRKRFQMDPAYAGHYTYDAVYVLTAAMRRSASVKPANVTQALKQIDGFAPVTGSMKWDAKGEQRYGVVGVYAARPNSWELLERSDVW